MRTQRSLKATRTVLSILAGVVAMPIVARAQITVDLAKDTGPIMYGATGFLYGLGDEGIPNENMIAGLVHTTTAAQKPPDGLQHPNGDALKVGGMFKKNGGKWIQIYTQDVYQQWTYEDLGIDDYIAKLTKVVNKVKADPNQDLFRYAPLNEPDMIWYGADQQRMFKDWNRIFKLIRSLHPNAPIDGPGITHYQSGLLRNFLTYCKQNDCLPDAVTWHELGDNFFTNWYNNIADYRAIEKSLGIPPIPVNINEYARQGRDLSVPGLLVQWITRFENSKVDACSAYWTSAGGLNDLVTQNNKPTGAWWLYKWYGELTGNTVATTSPNMNIEGLQGFAALDNTKKQVRVILGGSGGSTNVVVKGLATAPWAGSSVHAKIWSTASTGLNPSSLPALKAEGDYTVSNGQVSIPLTGMVGTTAYLVVVSPATNKAVTGLKSPLEAEYARIEGPVIASSQPGYSATGYVDASAKSAKVYFIANVATDGYYEVKIRHLADAATPARIGMEINGLKVLDLALSGGANWSDMTMKAFLQAGINRITLTNSDGGKFLVDFLDYIATTGGFASYEAEASANALAGTAAVASNASASGTKIVTKLGGGANNTLQFADVTVATAGSYRMVATFANGELGPGADNYNSNVVDRYADISVNGKAAGRTWYRNTLGWTTFRTAVTPIDLVAGKNTIKFVNSSTDFVPDLDKIAIYSTILEAPSTTRLVRSSTSKPGLSIRMDSRGSGVEIDYVLSGQEDGVLEIRGLDGRLFKRFESLRSDGKTSSAQVYWDGVDATGAAVQSGTLLVTLREAKRSSTIRAFKAR
jgi:hypothetical protein